VGEIEIWQFEADHITESEPGLEAQLEHRVIAPAGQCRGWGVLAGRWSSCFEGTTGATSGGSRSDCRRSGGRLRGRYWVRVIHRDHWRRAAIRRLTVVGSRR
jgi:hypothetical protein